MVDLTPIEKYLEEPDNFMINYVPHEIKRLGLDKFLQYSIDSINASKVWPNGLRPIQTNTYIYVRAITELVYTINNYVEEKDKDKWFEKLLTQHSFNIEYEKTNPPIFYGGEKAERKFKQLRNKVSSEHKKPRKRENNEPTAAEKKLAAKVFKINSLNIKLKS